VPAGELEAAVEMVRDRMENALKLDVPIKVDINIGKNWSRMVPLSQEVLRNPKGILN
jgi:DNA polymerase I-like protein with 3'-5' exonuclease and polymerase domains